MPSAKVAVIGYGSQGRAMAQNLSDSGYDITVGLRVGSKSEKVVRADGLAFAALTEAVIGAEIAIIAIPDHTHKAVFKESLGSALEDGTTVVFLHGLSIHFGQVNLSDLVDIVLLAPHAPGLAVREKFLTNRSISAFYAINRDQSGYAAARLFGLADAVGFAKHRLIETTFEAEAIGDIFGEQAVLCGGLAMLIKNGFEVLVENGLKPENAWLEVGYQLDLIVALIKEHGIEGMLRRISVAARLGAVENGPKIIGPAVKKDMQDLFEQIKSGQFASQLANLNQESLQALEKNLSLLSNQSIEKVAKEFK